MKLGIVIASLLLSTTTGAATGNEERFRAAFGQVKIGMTRDQVNKIGQVGNRCADWPSQRPPECGPLHYYHKKRVTETASGTTMFYDYGDGDEIVYRDGVVVLIRR